MYDNDTVRFEVHVPEKFRAKVQSGDLSGLADFVAVYSPEEWQQLSRYRPEDEYSGGVGDPAHVSPKTVPDIAIGLRVPTDGYNRLSARVIDEMTFDRGEGSFTASYVCSAGATHRWTFRLSDFALTEYSLQAQDTDFLTWVIECERFDNVNGIMLPEKIRNRRYRTPTTEERKSQDITILVHSYDLKRQDVEALVPIAWPPGTRVNDLRTTEMFIADDDGNLQPVETAESRVHPGDRDRTSQATTAAVGPLVGVIGRADNDHSNRAIIAIAAGAVLGVLGLLLLRDPRRVSRGAAALIVVAVMLTSPLGAHAQNEDTDKQQEARARAEARAAEQHARRTAYDDRQAENMAARLVRDLDLNDDQAHLVTGFIAQYRVDDRETEDSRMDRFRAWHEDYWQKRLPNEPEGWFEKPQSSGVVRYQRHVQIRPGVLAIVSLEDEAYELARLRHLADVELEFVRPHRASLKAALFVDIESILLEAQLDRWPRARLRLNFATHDAMHDYRGGGPAFDLDMLGLLEEAAAEGAELHPLAAEILDITPTDDPTELQRAIETFEHFYLAAYQAYDEQWKRAYEYRRDGISRDEPAGKTVEDDWSRSYRRVYDLRMAFVAQVKSIATADISHDAAARWETRFYTRCSRWLFEPERVDDVAAQLNNLEIPEHTRAHIENWIQTYTSRRHQARVQGIRLLITARGADQDDHADAAAAFQEWFADRQEDADNALNTLKAVVQSHAPTLVDQINWGPTENHGTSIR